MTAVISKVCSNIASSASQLEARLHVQRSPRTAPGAPQLPEDADGTCSPGRWGARRWLLPSPFLFPCKAFFRQKVQCHEIDRHPINLRTPQRPENPPTENNAMIISPRLVIFWCQHHISGTAWKCWFLWIVCMRQSAHALSTVLTPLTPTHGSTEILPPDFIHGLPR